MRELSLHILDIAENGLDAGASLVDIAVVEDSRENQLRIQIKDNGRGMSDAVLKQVADPFYTTRSTRRVGLGISLFREASKRCDGEFKIESEEGSGTAVLATFRMDHIDLAPLGDMPGSLIGLIVGNPEADFIYHHEANGEIFHLDTRSIKKDLDGLPLVDPEVLRALSRLIREGFERLKGKHGDRPGEPGP